MPNRPFSEKELQEKMLEMMKRAGTAPEIVYAFQKTGRLVTDETYEKLSQKERDEWDAAIDEYLSQHPET